MEKLTTFQELEIFPLTKSVAEKYIHKIINTLNLIPEVEEHTPESIFADSKNKRLLHAKWDHGLIVLTKDKKFVGIVMSYERETEGNMQYPKNSLYLSDLAIAQEFQKRGIGKFLVNFWIEWNQKNGF